MLSGSRDPARGVGSGAYADYSVLRIAGLKLISRCPAAAGGAYYLLDQHTQGETCMRHTDFTVTIRLKGIDRPVGRIAAIKWFKALLGIGLREAKELVDSLPHFKSHSDPVYNGEPVVHAYSYQYVDLVVSPSVYCFYHFKGCDGVFGYPEGACYEVDSILHEEKNNIVKIPVG